MVEEVGENLNELAVDGALAHESHCAGFACSRATRRLRKTRHDDHRNPRCALEYGAGSFQSIDAFAIAFEDHDVYGKAVEEAKRIVDARGFP